MDERYLMRYRELYERHWWWRARERIILDAVRNAAPPAGWRRILDVGCGDGLLFDHLAQLGEVEGIDPSAHADGPWADRIHIAPFDASFNPRQHYSLILFLDVLEHLDQPQDALRTAIALLEDDGYVLITVPAFPQLWTSHDELNHHRARYTANSLSAMLNSAGLDVVDTFYFFHWLAGAKLIVRYMERIIAAEPAPPRVPIYAINRGLELACKWEARLVGPLRLPLGSSLLALARRKR